MDDPVCDHYHRVAHLAESFKRAVPVRKLGAPLRGDRADRLDGDGQSDSMVVPTLTQDTSTATLFPPSPSPTRTVAFSTPTLNSFHTLETPIGSEYQFIIHRILDGESLNSISNKYRTTPEALRLVNYDLLIPLMTNSLIIIPVNQTDVSGLPAFEAYTMKGDIPVEDLAQQLMVDPSVLEYFNALKVGQVLTADEWVLVPHLATATP